MPLKEAVLELGEVDRVARLAGAGNTLIFDADGSGGSTTPTSVVWSGALRPAAGARTAGTILGSGATARSSLVVAGPSWGPSEVTVVARTPAKAAVAGALGRELGVELRPAGLVGARSAVADLVVSTVSAGAADDRGRGAGGQRAGRLRRHLRTPGRPRWPRRRPTGPGTVVNGLDLLVGQALLQIELMTGSSGAGRACSTGRARRPRLRLTCPDSGGFEPAKRWTRGGDGAWKTAPMLRWLTAGESHGPALVAILEGLPAARPGHHRRHRRRAGPPPARLRPRRPDEVRGRRGDASSAASGTARPRAARSRSRSATPSGRSGRR